MILLDTNILSEVMRVEPQIQVMSWFAQQKSSDLFISSVSIAEIAYGLDILVKSRRRTLLEAAFEKFILQGFKTRVLSFDTAAAHVYGRIMGKRKSLGRPLSVSDGQIAAIAISQGAALATRNVRDFINCELELINPFDELEEADKQVN